MFDCFSRDGFNVVNVPSYNIISVIFRKDPGFIRMNVHDAQNMKDDVS